MTLLRKILFADAITCALSAIVLIVAATALESVFGLSSSLLRGAGLIFIPFVAMLAYVATRPVVPRTGVWLIVILNALWAVDSVLVLWAGWIAPTFAGCAFLIGQALVVAVFAELEFIGLRRLQRAA